MNAFIEKLLKAAKEAGLEACEAYIVTGDSFSARSTEGELLEYKSNASHGLGFRGLKNGRMGYASTQAFDDDAVAQLVKGVVESAELCEDDDPAIIYRGGDELPALSLQSDALADVTAGQKLALLTKLEETVKAYDPRIEKTAGNVVRTGSHGVRIVNSYGMDRSYSQDVCILYGEATAREGEKVSSGFHAQAFRDFDKLDPQTLGTDIARNAVDNLQAKQLPSGKYRVVFTGEAMCDMLSTFCGIFSAENAHKGMSLLKGRIGETIAAPCITLVDDPLLPDGLDSRPFDDEGVASRMHTVIEGGVFRTFLHNLKTAQMDGVESTGNASKASYASPVHIAPTNFFFRPGTKTVEELLGGIGEGVVITEVSGLHAGANPVSGDFSLLSKGYTFKDGKRVQFAEQITVAGNFYELLKNARDVACDLVFPMGGIGSPSMDVGELTISGC